MFLCCCLYVTPCFIWGNHICKWHVVVCLLICVCSCFLFWGYFISPSSSSLCRWLFDVLSCNWHRGGEGRGRYSVDLRPQASCILHMWNVKLPVSVSLRLLAGVSCIRRRVCRSKVKPTVIPSTCQATVATPFLSSPLRLSKMAPLGTARVELES